MMLDEDQREVRACSKTTRQSPKGVDVSDVWERFRAKAKKRADRMIEILNIIGAPTIENVGKDGSQAISVLALHTSLDTMKEVLKSFEDSYKNDPKSVYNEAIPSL
ncbi:MAG TPA: hypothetical protein VM535_00595, partial [Candidatus Saccharimonadales bacterium]|nr:hypothetical protein [Candidatus Saccharimonadales bacterium]